jgi:hypothetical protein
MGKYRSQLSGTQSAPIVVRSYPGEWAKIEGYLTTTLAEALPNAPGDPVTVVVADGRAFSDPTSVFIGSEILTLGRRQPDGRTWTNSVRATSGTIPSAHSVGDLVFDNSKTLTVSGQYTYYRDFEVMNSNPTRDYNLDWGQLAPGVRGTGIFVVGSTGIKFINLVIHDNQEGIYASVTALDMEVYGCIIYNNGFVDWQRGHGQGLYMQNQVGQKKIRNVISFNNFTDGMKAYSESGFAQNFLFEHVISFNNGSSATLPGNHGNNGSPLPPGKRYPNIFAGTGNSGNPINDIRIHDCYLFNPNDTSPENGSLALGYQGLAATGLEIINSRIMGGDHAIALTHFLSGTVTGNRVYAQQSGPWTGTASAGLANVSFEVNPLINWNNNIYFDQTPLHLGTTSYPFTYAIAGIAQISCDGGAALRFTYTGCTPNGGWKEIAGADSSSTYAYAAPTGTDVLVVPNEYEAGRANIAIYNWALAPSVAVDLSNVLQIGDQYSVYAAENYLGPPVLVGTYSGGSISIPMTGTTVHAPIGLGWAPTTVRPQFGAFVVKRS